MNRKIKKYLFDIITCIDEIEMFLRVKKFQSKISKVTEKL